jgi:hypothetical protein
LGRPENIWNILPGMSLECQNSEKKERRKIKRCIDVINWKQKKKENKKDRNFSSSLTKSVKRLFIGLIIPCGD